MSVRGVVSSTDGTDFFSDNSPFNFRVKLNRNIQLDGYWMVALTEFTLNKTNSFDKNLYILSDICQNSFIGNTEKPLLRRVMLNRKKNGNIIFYNPYYIPVRSGIMEHIHIYITDDEGSLASFLRQPVTVTLHFKKFSFIL